MKIGLGDYVKIPSSKIGITEQLNIEVREAVQEAAAKFCDRSGNKLSYINYDGFTIEYNSNSSATITWDISAKIARKEEGEWLI